MNPTRGWRVWRPAFIAAIGLVLVSGFGARMRPDHAHGQDRRDCPHDWKGFPKPGAPNETIAQIAIAPDISEIPEFHDCQKLIQPAINAGYTSQPVAIFAHQTLLGQFELLLKLIEPNATVTTVRWTTPNAQAPGGDIVSSNGTPVLRDPGGGPKPINVAAGDALVFAEILNYGGEYAPLGIKTGFNCLFVGISSAGLRAAMVPTPDDNHCLRIARFDTLIANGHGKELTVRATATNFTLDDFPPVARWDWDGQNRKHVIGIMCGPAWCEVGDGAFVASVAPQGGPKRAIKGWYDQQRLATKNAFGGLSPSSMVGTVFPSSNLGTYTDASFTKQWAHVASISIVRESGEYKTKLNLDPSPQTEARNLVSLCKATVKADCAPLVRRPGRDGRPIEVRDVNALPDCRASTDGLTWWARIQGAAGGSPAYRCVTNWKAPSGFGVPATARWRWLKDDETIWQACIHGCCEVET